MFNLNKTNLNIIKYIILTPIIVKVIILVTFNLNILPFQYFSELYRIASILYSILRNLFIGFSAYLLLSMLNKSGQNQDNRIIKEQILALIVTNLAIDYIQIV